MAASSNQQSNHELGFLGVHIAGELWGSRSTKRAAVVQIRGIIITIHHTSEMRDKPQRAMTMNGLILSAAIVDLPGTPSSSI